LRDVKLLGSGAGDFEGPGAKVRNVDGRLHVARKARRPDDWDPPIDWYVLYGRGAPHRANEKVLR
jgi:hypothetical protein